MDQTRLPTLIDHDTGRRLTPRAWLTQSVRFALELLAVAAATIVTTVLLAHTANANESVLTLERVARRHNYAPASIPLLNDQRDTGIASPKSVRFSADGKKLYVNSLEGGKTLVYAWPSLQRIKVISHNFTKSHAPLFHGETTVFDYPYIATPPYGEPNVFMGKPVESELSHGGRWLWVPYYRRSFDPLAQGPSAVAIIDTTTDKIVRVMPTGPIPKYVAASPDGRYVAITHWGDNTIALIDTSSGEPSSFRYIDHLIIERKLRQDALTDDDRDKSCGLCLRGTVFTPDSQHLLVARMGGRWGRAGVSAFHLPTKTYLGLLKNFEATPRHLALSPDGKFLYVSSNAAGAVAKVSVDQALTYLWEAQSSKRAVEPSWQKTLVGRGARTLDLSSDGRVIFAAVFNANALVAIDAESMRVITSVSLDKFPVGLALSPDDRFAVITSQGAVVFDQDTETRTHVGGNVVNVVKITYGEFYRERSPGPAPLR